MKVKIKEAIRFFSKPKNLISLIVIIIAIVGLVISSYYIFVYRNVCRDQACFDDALVRCKKAIYISNKPETIMQYQILGKSKEGCEVNVKMLQIRKGSVELEPLAGKDMICTIPLETYIAPESNIKECHGLLKEGIQEIMIQRMHSELIENIGQISEEITEIL